MDANYFKYVSDELLLRLAQIREFIKKHNPTIGVLTEEILKEFLATYLPKCVSVEQGFIKSSTGNISKQCDIIVYDNQSFAPLYRVNNIVILPQESIIAVIEVKTTINKQIFNTALTFFKNLNKICPEISTTLFIYSNVTDSDISRYLSNYNFDHDTFQELPDSIVGIENSFMLVKDRILDTDNIGYSFYSFSDSENNKVTALQNFYILIHNEVIKYLSKKKTSTSELSKYYNRKLIRLKAISLFSM